MLPASLTDRFMKKNLLILLLLIKTSFCYSQQTNTCSCEGLVNTDYKNSIVIYDKPFGQIKHSIKQDFKNEDYLTFIIDKDSANFFHLTFSYSLKDITFTGWTTKANYLGTFSRVYNDTLNLFSRPNLTSKIKSRIATWTNALLPITSCKDKWVYIKLNKDFEGWLQHKDQCANPYTTCN